jgi:hypothetical protein
MVWAYADVRSVCCGLSVVGYNRMSGKSKKERKREKAEEKEGREWHAPARKLHYE